METTSTAKANGPLLNKETLMRLHKHTDYIACWLSPLAGITNSNVPRISNWPGEIQELWKGYLKFLFETHPQELGLYFYHMGLNVDARSSGLAAGSSHAEVVLQPRNRLKKPGQELKIRNRAWEDVFVGKVFATQEWRPKFQASKMLSARTCSCNPSSRQWTHKHSGACWAVGPASHSRDRERPCLQQ